MIKLDLLKKIKINLSKAKFDEASLVKIEKLLLAEHQINPEISKQDIIELLSFLKTDWQMYKPILLNWNVQSFLFGNRKYKIYSRLIETKRVEELGRFFTTHFSQNIEIAVKNLMRKNEWGQLLDLKNNYPYLLGSFDLEMELEKMLEDIFYNVQRKNAPSNFKENYSTKEGFFLFLFKLNAEYKVEIDDLYDKIQIQLENDLPKQTKKYFSEVKSASLFSDSNASSKSSKAIFIILSALVISLSILMYVKSLKFFIVHFIFVFFFSLAEKRSDYLKEEMIYFDESISLRQFRLRKTINHVAILFFAAFILSIPFALLRYLIIYIL